MALRIPSRIRQYLADYFTVLGEDRRRLPGMIVLVLLSGLLDVLGIGLLAPFLGLVFASTTDSSFQWFGLSLSSFESKRVIAILSTLVVIAFLFKAVTAVALQKRIIAFSEFRRVKLMRELMHRILMLPYERLVERSSASVVNVISRNTAQYSAGTLGASLKLVADVIMFAAVLALLAFTDLLVVSILSLLLAFTFFCFYVGLKGSLRDKSRIMSETGTNIVSSINHTVGAAREIKLLKCEEFFLDKLEGHAWHLARTQAYVGGINAIPRYAVEVCMVVFLVTVTLLSIYLHQEPARTIAVLGAFAAAAVRLMPGTTSLITNINSLKLSRHALATLASQIRSEDALPPRENEESPPRRKILYDPIQAIRLEEVSFAYRGTDRNVLTDLTLDIHAGSSVGLIGRSGCGKTTLAGILLGLLNPTSGRMLVNGVSADADLDSWRNRCAYIPQDVFLIEDSLRHNIALGVAEAEIDDGQLHRAIEFACLQDVVSNLPGGVEESVGERGAWLSGGQRQRVAIARAFYHNREFLVLDEATAALDNETEQEVVEALRHLSGTVTTIVIAHRISTLRSCDVIVRMDEGRIVEVFGSYEELASVSPTSEQ